MTLAATGADLSADMAINAQGHHRRSPAI